MCLMHDFFLPHLLKRAYFSQKRSHFIIKSTLNQIPNLMAMNLEPPFLCFVTYPICKRPSRPRFFLSNRSSNNYCLIPSWKCSGIIFSNLTSVVQRFDHQVDHGFPVESILDLIVRLEKL